MLILLILLLFSILILFNNYGFLYYENPDYSSLSKRPYLDGAESFESVTGSSKAILFIHGFPGSPKMYYLARELAIKSGYDVYIPRIPGFGTDPMEFITSNFSMWYNFISDYYNTIRPKYEKFYVVGNSMGGALTLKLAECSGLKPTAIASVAAPVFLNSIKRGVFKSPILYFLRYIKFFIKYIPSKKPPRDKSLDQDGETEWVGYRGLFPGQIYSLSLGLRKIKRELKKINVPCYLCQAKKDKTVSYKNLNYIKSNISSRDIMVRIMDLRQWKHSNHSMFIYKSVINTLWSEIDSFFSNL